MIEHNMSNKKGKFNIYQILFTLTQTIIKHNWKDFRYLDCAMCNIYKTRNKKKSNKG